MTPEQLRQARARLGLSQAQLGRAVEPPITRHKVSELEGAQRIAPGMAARLREAIRRLEQE